MSNLLFICSKNQWRSPTAETLFKNHPLNQARSAGTSDKARIKINQRLIELSDVVFVMERKHLDILRSRFAKAIAGKQVIVLNIPDEYLLGDPELIQLLKAELEGYL